VGSAREQGCGALGAVRRKKGGRLGRGLTSFGRVPAARPAPLAAPHRWSRPSQVNNAILYDKTSHEKMLAEVPKFKMITISILSDRLRINCSLARRTLAYLVVRPPRHGSCGGTAGLAWQCSGDARAWRGTTLGLGLFPQLPSARRAPPLLTPCPLLTFHVSQEKGLVREVVRHAKQARGVGPAPCAALRDSQLTRARCGCPSFCAGHLHARNQHLNARWGGELLELRGGAPAAVGAHSLVWLGTP
jgi:small subunit ribosomal protein S25e